MSSEQPQISIPFEDTIQQDLNIRVSLPPPDLSTNIAHRARGKMRELLQQAASNATMRTTGLNASIEEHDDDQSRHSGAATPIQQRSPVSVGPGPTSRKKPLPRNESPIKRFVDGLPHDGEAQLLERLNEIDAQKRLLEAEAAIMRARWA